MTYDVDDFSSLFKPSGTRQSVASTVGKDPDDIDVIALLGCACPVKAAALMRCVGWPEDEITRWLET